MLHHSRSGRVSCDNLLGTDRDVVVDRLADEIMEGFERGGQLDPRIQLSHYEEEIL